MNVLTHTRTHQHRNEGENIKKLLTIHNLIILHKLFSFFCYEFCFFFFFFTHMNHTHSFHCGSTTSHLFLFLPLCLCYVQWFRVNVTTLNCLRKIYRNYAICWNYIIIKDTPLHSLSSTSALTTTNGTQKKCYSDLQRKYTKKRIELKYLEWSNSSY